MATFKILSLDGGGIRGLLTAVLLHELEKSLEEPLHTYFDLLAGTSTGSILACGIASGIKTEKIIDLYMEEGRTIFPGSFNKNMNRLLRTFSQGVSAPKYSDKGLKKVLSKVFGEKKFGNLNTRTLVTAYDVLNRDAIVFKSFKAPFDKLYIWEVCKSSASAPTYFPAHVMKISRSKVPLIDGGVVANNPTACAISEAIVISKKKNLQVSHEDIIVASFGTGEMTRPITIDESREWGALEWAVPIIDVLFDGAEDATNYISKQIVGEQNYFRFQTKLDSAYDDMDNADLINLNALVSKAESYLKNEGGKQQIQKLVKLLEAE